MITKKTVKICVLGASFDTNNMGVSALTSGIIRCIDEHLPNAHVILLKYGMKKSELNYSVGENTLIIENLNMRFSKKFYLKNNIALLIIMALFLRCIPCKRIRNKIISENVYFNAIRTADIVTAISGGDSFSDIYGQGRFFYAALPQLLVILLGRKIIQLPQTYGPYNGVLTRIIARHILKNSDLIYSRDYEGINEVNKLFKNGENTRNVKFSYDVGFALEPKKPDVIDLGTFFEIKNDKATIIGLNISGLLLAGGYTRNNMFGLKVNYRDLIKNIIETLMKEDTIILLVPHVFGSHFQSDYSACISLYEELKTAYPDRLFVVNGTYNQNEIKYIIGLCDFFIGSRMHACIAALSQCIPAVGLAYSKKFKGVFETVGAKDLIADPRTLDEKEIIQCIREAFDNKTLYKERLEKEIPEALKGVLNLFRPNIIS